MQNWIAQGHKTGSEDKNQTFADAGIGQSEETERAIRNFLYQRKLEAFGLVFKLVA